MKKYNVEKSDLPREIKYIDKCVTVLLSSYNNERFIEDQILSIMEQQYVNVTLFVRDDGSKDRTPEIIRDLINKYNGKIKLIVGDNIGIQSSFDYLYRNAAITDFFAFSDGDDVWDSDKLYIAVSSLINNDSDFYSSSSRLVSENLTKLNKTTENVKKYNHYMVKKSQILTPGAQGCTIVINRRLIEKLVGFKPNITFGHDIWVTAVAYNISKPIYDAKPHMNYRQHNASWTGNRKNTFAQYKREVGFFFKGSSRYYLLATEILKGYSDIIPPEKRLILEMLVLSKKSFSKRIKLLFLKGFGKYGLARNFVFKLFLMFGKF